MWSSVSRMTYPRMVVTAPVPLPVSFRMMARGRYRSRSSCGSASEGNDSLSSVPCDWRLSGGDISGRHLECEDIYGKSFVRPQTVSNGQGASRSRLRAMICRVHPARCLQIRGAPVRAFIPNGQSIRILRERLKESIPLSRIIRGEFSPIASPHTVLGPMIAAPPSDVQLKLQQQGDESPSDVTVVAPHRRPRSPILRFGVPLQTLRRFLSISYSLLP